MASQALASLLMPQIFVESVSWLKAGRGQIGSWLGFHPTKYDKDSVQVSGPNTLSTGNSVRTLMYGIMNHTRVPLPFRSPNVGPATTAANPLGRNTVTIARAHAKIRLEYELLGNLAQMFQPNSMIDTGGQSYIMRQQEFLVEQGHNSVEVMAAGMLRDSLYLINQGGDDWRPSFTAPTGNNYGYQVNFQIPSTNKGQLPQTMGTNPTGPPIIDLPWNNDSAKILTQINAVIAAYALLSRYSMTDILINSTNLMNILTNSEVRNTAGSANAPFAALEYDQRETANNGPAMRRVRIKGAPDVNFLMIDDAAALGGDTDPINPASSTINPTTLAKYVPDNMAIFTTNPNSGNWTKLWYGGEYVSEYPGDPPKLRMGFYSWTMPSIEPTCVFLYILMNAIPVLYNPYVVAPAVVLGF